LVFVGSYTANNQIADLIVTLIFGVLSYFMVLFGWPRRLPFWDLSWAK